MLGCGCGSGLLFNGDFDILVEQPICNPAMYDNVGGWFNTSNGQYLIAENNILPNYIFEHPKNHNLYVRSGRMPLMTTIMYVQTDFSGNTVTHVSDETFIKASSNQDIVINTFNGASFSKWCNFEIAADLDACGVKYGEVSILSSQSLITGLSSVVTFSFYNDSCGKYFDLGGLGYAFTPPLLYIQLPNTSVTSGTGFATYSALYENQVLFKYYGGGLYKSDALDIDYQSRLGPLFNINGTVYIKTNISNFQFLANNRFAFYGLIDVWNAPGDGIIFDYPYPVDYYRQSKLLYNCYCNDCLLDHDFKYNNIVLGANYKNDINYVNGVRPYSTNVIGSLHTIPPDKSTGGIVGPLHCCAGYGGLLSISTRYGTSLGPSSGGYLIRDTSDFDKMYAVNPNGYNSSLDSLNLRTNIGYRYYAPYYFLTGQYMLGCGSANSNPLFRSVIPGPIGGNWVLGQGQAESRLRYSNLGIIHRGVQGNDWFGARKDFYDYNMWDENMNSRYDRYVYDTFGISQNLTDILLSDYPTGLLNMVVTIESSKKVTDDIYMKEPTKANREAIFQQKGIRL